MRSFIFFFLFFTFCLSCNRFAQFTSVTDQRVTGSFSQVNVTWTTQTSIDSCATFSLVGGLGSDKISIRNGDVYFIMATVQISQVGGPARLGVFVNGVELAYGSTYDTAFPMALTWFGYATLPSNAIVQVVILPHRIITIDDPVLNSRIVSITRTQNN